MIMHHSSESEISAKEIVKRLQEIGFTTSLGAYDYQFDWERIDVSMDEVLQLVDRVTDKLRGTKCWFHFSSIPD
jgi:hypothetical protein